MEIKELKANSGNVDLVVTIVSMEEPRTFEKFGKSGKVCNAKIKDNSGEVKMTLWNEDIESVKTGDKIHLQNGWCSEFKEELQVSSGKFGKIEVLESSTPEVLTNDPSLLNPMSTSGDEPEVVDNVEEVTEEETIE